MQTYSNFGFDIHHKSDSSHARAGVIKTPHGEIQTPAFIFCATKAAIKSVSAQQTKDCQTQIILSNTYHLMLQPGSELIEKMGGLHKFMGWDGPMLTDSGGYQIFSLGHGSVASEIKGKRLGNRQKTLLKITEEGAKFKSYVDGKIHMLTPESSIAIQRQLGADLIVVLDECTPFNVDKKYTETSMNMSHRWAQRSLAEFLRGDDGRQALYGIIQGGVYDDLRTIGCDFVNSERFFGHAIGGSLGADRQQMHDIVATTMRKLDPSRPVHLLGIGKVADIFNGVKHGVDTFDCVHPTRLGRHGGALVKTPAEHINLLNSRFRDDPNPIDTDCPCDTCQTLSCSYLHHLLKAKEIFAMQALTVHNMTFMNLLMQAIRRGIIDDRLDDVRREWLG